MSLWAVASGRALHPSVPGQRRGFWRISALAAHHFCEHPGLHYFANLAANFSVRLLSSQCLPTRLWRMREPQIPITACAGFESGVGKKAPVFAATARPAEEHQARQVCLQAGTAFLSGCHASTGHFGSEDEHRDDTRGIYAVATKDIQIATAALRGSAVTCGPCHDLGLKACGTDVGHCGGMQHAP